MRNRGHAGVLVIRMENARAATDALCAALGLAPGSLDWEPPQYARCRTPYAQIARLVQQRGLDIYDYYDSSVAQQVAWLIEQTRVIVEPGVYQLRLDL